MAKSLSYLQLSLLFHSSKRLPLLSLGSTKCFFSSPCTPFPLQYDMIISRPSPSPSPSPSPRGPTTPLSKPTESSDFNSAESQPGPDLSFEDWVDNKLSQQDTGMDKSKRKYYKKREKRMYGGYDSEEERRKLKEKSEVVELKPEIVELRSLHKREEELFFYDAFAFPWEKDKHYKMVYQLEKKYFPQHSLDKAFLEPGQAQPNKRVGAKGDDHQGLVFFDGDGDERVNEGKDDGVGVGGVKDVSVEEFFKCLRNVPNKNGKVSDVGDPFLASRTTGLPPKWDSPAGTVVLVNKPKGWTSFTVCGKLRRLTKVKKVGHAGTLDPMATGLLIVCVGKATKLVDRYQGMIKGYSGIFRLGEATSTWDADSPVIQREPWEHIKDDDIKKAAASFTGEIWQVPPMFSAIKVGGEKMYEKARRGESIELSPRRISIFQFDINRSLEDRQNLIFRVICSKGTYIRSLCADLGKALGSCAHLIALRRDSIGEFFADDAFEFQELEEQITKGYL